MQNRRLIVILVATVVVVVAITAVMIFVIVPGTTPAVNTGTPVAPKIPGIATRAKTPTAAPTAAGSSKNLSQDGVELVSFHSVSRSLPQRGDLQQFISCTELRGATATPKPKSDVATSTPTPTPDVTAEPTVDPASIDSDYIVVDIVGAESEACYQVGEIFLDGNQFNIAIGVSHAIAGEIAIDRANIANSKIGDIVVDISQFQSDEPQRDGRIRRQWLESNKYPLIKLTDTKVIGLPVRAYKEGEVLHFQVVGNLLVRDVTKEKTFNVTASLKDNTLIGTATTDFLMTDFGFDPPNIADLLKANNQVHVVFNFVAREPSGDSAAATP